MLLLELAPAFMVERTNEIFRAFRKKVLYNRSFSTLGLAEAVTVLPTMEQAGDFVTTHTFYVEKCFLKCFPFYFGQIFIFISCFKFVIIFLLELFSPLIALDGH